MKNTLSVLLATLLLSAGFISCNGESGKSKESGLEIPTEDFQPGAEWTLAWADEFNQGVIDTSNWTLQVLEAGHFNGEWQRYTNSPENAFVENNCLVIKAIHESEKYSMDQFSSARLHTGNKHSWKYGKIAARIKLPEGNGIWPAFWMLGANITEIGGDTPWPQSGEIDILELFGNHSDAVVEGNLHYADSADQHAMSGPVGYTLKEGKFADAFHVFELDWNENRMVWLVDGVKYYEVPITADIYSEFHQPFYILLNVAVGGLYAGSPDSNSPYPQSMYVDWVRVYQK